jgi:hypothetical protein
MNWIILPYRDTPIFVGDAVRDCLAQTLPDLRLLLIDNGSGDHGREVGEYWQKADSRVLRWRHDPPLPSLSATWNTALQAVWAAGGEHALVVNSDVRLYPQTYEYLLQALTGQDALLVSAVGVTQAQFEARLVPTPPDMAHRGGPDFSCFLLAKAGHQQYPFDEGFQPAFCEDLDIHRRMLLAGDGGRVFSINLPYLHYGSQTLKSMAPDLRATTERQISQGSRTHYEKKWGGPVNAERYTRPFDPTSAQDGVTTPQLQQYSSEVLHAQTTR